MAMYSTIRGNVFGVKEVTGKSGKNYVKCSIAVNSKSKDKEGSYTIEDQTLFVNAIGFGTVVEAMAKLESNFFAEVLVKASTRTVDKKSYINWQLLKITPIVTHANAPKEVQTNDIIEEDISDEDLYSEDIPF